MDSVNFKSPLGKNTLAWALAAGALSLLSLFLLLPVLNLLYEGFSHSLNSSLFSDSWFWEVVVFTYSQAFFSACLSGAFGFWGALIFVESGTGWKKSLWHLSALSFSLPSLLVALAFIGVWGRSGWVNGFLSHLGVSEPVSFYGWPLILLAHVFFNYPLFLKQISTALLEMGRLEEKAAISLGANRWQCFWHVTFPKILPSFQRAFGLAFLYCASSFLIVLFLGGGPRFTSVEVAVFEAVKVDFDLALASRLALLQLIVSFAVLWLLGKSRKGKVTSERLAFFRLYPPRKTSLGFFFFVFLILVILPLLILIGEGIPALGQGFHELSSSLLLSLKLAGLTVLWCVVVAFALAYAERHIGLAWVRRLISLITSLPVALSSLLISLALFLTYTDWLAGLRGSLFPISCLQAIAALPVVFRCVQEGYGQLPFDYIKAARSLGAGPIGTLVFVELPLLRRSLVLSALLAFAFSLGEVSSVLLLVSGDLVTLPLYLYRLIGQYRFEEAGAVGLVLMVTLLLTQGLIGRFEKR